MTRFCRVQGHDCPQLSLRANSVDGHESHPSAETQRSLRHWTRVRRFSRLHFNGYGAAAHSFRVRHADCALALCRRIGDSRSFVSRHGRHRCPGELSAVEFIESLGGLSLSHRPRHWCGRRNREHLRGLEEHLRIRGRDCRRPHGARSAERPDDDTGRRPADSRLHATCE